MVRQQSEAAKRDIYIYLLSRCEIVYGGGTRCKFFIEVKHRFIRTTPGARIRNPGTILVEQLCRGAPPPKNEILDFVKLKLCRVLRLE
jgi:hypothetical protein